MAKVQGVKEKLHYSIYDAFFVDKDEQFGLKMEKEEPRAVRFFVDVQGKTKLETNLQTPGVLPSLKPFEVRAMRVVASTPQVKLEDKAILLAATGSDPEKLSKVRKLLLDATVAVGSGSSAILADLIYNSVTTLLIGEKIIIEVPTFNFAAGLMAAFRFSEPVIIEPQQNFRVEMQFPRGAPESLKEIRGPFRVWVMLDGAPVARRGRASRGS